MWGGRFDEAPDAVMRAINASLPFDKAMWRQDIAASRAHAAMLGAKGIVSASDVAAIDAGLARLVEEFERDGPPDGDDEDIHMAVEARLTALIGPTAGRLHTARSRNDQVATDFRLWVRDATDRALAGIGKLRAALLDRAEERADAVMPGFTHLQSAQPVTLGHHLMAWQEMLTRDASRFADARARANLLALGQRGARRNRLSGRSPRDGARLSASTDPTANSLDSVSDRDFAIEYPHRRHAMRAASVAHGGGNRHLGVAAVRLCPICPIAGRRAARSCRKSAIPMPPNWFADIAGASWAASPR